MNIMTKRGSLDNQITYEHYCDTKADLANIPSSQISLGSIAIVLKDENDSMGIYLANSNKEWISFSNGEGGDSITNLLDISLTNPTDGQTLIYNEELGKWENKNSNTNVMVIDMNSESEQEVNYDGEYGFSYICNKPLYEIYEHCLNGGIACFRLDSNDIINIYWIDAIEYNDNYYHVSATKNTFWPEIRQINKTTIFFTDTFLENRVLMLSKNITL